MRSAQGWTPRMSMTYSAPRVSFHTPTPSPGSAGTTRPRSHPPVHADDGSVIRYGCETVLVGPWWMLTLAQSLEYRRMHLSITGGSIELHGAGDADPARESWLPIATSEGAGELCLDTAAAGAAPLYVLDPESLREGTPEQFASLAEFAAAMTRAVEDGHVTPHPHDSRAPMIDASQLPDELRPLAYW